MTHLLLHSITFTGPGQALHLEKTYKGSLWTWTPSRTHPSTLSMTSPLKRLCGPASRPNIPPQTDHHTWHVPSPTATPSPLQSKQPWQKEAIVSPPSYANCAPAIASTQIIQTTSVQAQTITPHAPAHAHPVDLTTHDPIIEFIAIQRNTSYSTASEPHQPVNDTFEVSDHYALSFSHRTLHHAYVTS